MKPRKILLTADDGAQVDLTFDGESLGIHIVIAAGEEPSAIVVISNQEDIRAIRGLLAEDLMPAAPGVRAPVEDGPMDRIRRIEDVLGGELFDRGDTVAERLDNHRRAINSTARIACVRARARIEDEEEKARQLHAWEARLSTRGLSLQDAVEMAMTNNQQAGHDHQMRQNRHHSNGRMTDHLFLLVKLLRRFVSVGYSRANDSLCGNSR